jgi:hypothetical protein
MTRPTHPEVMDPIPITFARDAARRALSGARLDDPVAPDAPSLLSRGRRALARARTQRLAIHPSRVRRETSHDRQSGSSDSKVAST